MEKWQFSHREIYRKKEEEAKLWNAPNSVGGGRGDENLVAQRIQKKLKNK